MKTTLWVAALLGAQCVSRSGNTHQGNDPPTAAPAAVFGPGASLVTTCGMICSNIVAQCGFASPLYDQCTGVCNDLILVPQTCVTEFAGYLACLARGDVGLDPLQRDRRHGPDRARVLRSPGRRVRELQREGTVRDLGLHRSAVNQRQLRGVERRRGAPGTWPAPSSAWASPPAVPRLAGKPGSSASVRTAVTTDPVAFEGPCGLVVDPR